jgi:tol-pal system protein YbgF
MKRALTAFGLILIFVAGFSGCITTSGSQQNQQDIGRLQARIAELEKRQTDLEARFAGVTEKSAEAYLAMDEMRQQVANMQGKFEEAEYSSSKYAKETEGLRTYMGAQLSTLDKRMKEVEKKLNISNAQSLDRLPAAGGAAAIVAGGDKKPEDLYNEAYNAYRAMNLEKAKALFGQFLKKYKRHKKAADARFYLADSFYKQQDYENAILEFDRVTADYPGSKRTKTAYLNLGLCFENMGSKADARLFYEKVVSDYPGTQEAKIAKKKLQLMR